MLRTDIFRSDVIVTERLYRKLMTLKIRESTGKFIMPSLKAQLILKKAAFGALVL